MEYVFLPQLSPRSWARGLREEIFRREMADQIRKGQSLIFMETVIISYNNRFTVQNTEAIWTQQSEELWKKLPKN